jgi:hypothetical protein
MTLQPLVIKEAVGGVIKLTGVPKEGATAFIPEPPNPQPGDSIRVLIEDQIVAEPGAEPYKVLVPRSALLDHIGSQKAFTYVIQNRDGNESDSDPVMYDIDHS